MRLYYIIFKPTDTRFICEEKNKKLALEKAIRANHEVGDVEEIDNKKEYSVELIDWKLLKTIFSLNNFYKRDYYGIVNDCVVFNE